MLEARSFVELTLNEQFDRLCESLNQRFGESDDAGEPFHEWVKNITLDGRPFTYDRHEYLTEPYRDNHPHQVEEKAAQMGLTIHRREDVRPEIILSIQPLEAS